MDLENDRNVINNNVMSLDKSCDETIKESFISAKEAAPESKENIPESVDNTTISVSNMEIEDENENVGNNEGDLMLHNMPENHLTNGSALEDSLDSKRGGQSNKRRILLQHSDSEDEDITKTDIVEVENDHTNNTRSAPNRIDSDSEDENVTNNTINNTTNTRKALKLIDSDSEESETPQAPIYNTNSKGELISESNTEQNWRLLCDPESSDEECRNENETKSDIEEDIPKPIVYKKKRSKYNKEEPAAAKITPKEASKVRQEITRESQRMIRESNISLPYHKPKSFSIKDFLSRRSQMASAVLPVINTQTPPSVAIKMSMDQLEAVTKKLKEREKEVKEFYKSESEGDEEGEDEDFVPPKSTEEKDGNKEIEGGNVDEHCVPPEEATNNNSEEKEDDKGDENETGQIEQNQQEETIPLDETEGTAQSNINLENTEDISIQGKTQVEPNNEEMVNDTAEKCTSEETTRLLEKYQESMDYEFSLSDSEGQTEDPQQPTVSFQYGELDREIERFQTAGERRSKIELIKKKFGDSTPRLSGNPNEVINLETGVSRPSELTEFVERFIKHTEKKQVHKDKVKLNIISVESGEIHEETVAMDVEEDDTLVIEEKPGIRLKKFRNELESQMAQMKSELWQKKTMAKEESERTKEGYEESEEIEDDILGDEEEEELSECGEEEDEEEDDVMMCDEKKRKKSEFVDDEAEEEDGEEFEEITNDVNDEEQQEVAEDDIEGHESVDGAVIEKDSEENVEGNAPKKLRRILKGFTEDSDDEENGDVSFQEPKNESSEGNSRGDMQDSITEDSTYDDERISLNQQTGQNVQSPLKTPNKSTLEFLTPISYITGLQNLNKSASKGSPVSPFRIPNVPSPLRDRNWQSSLQKKLFNDGEITNSQIEDIAEFCSENFTESQAVEENLITQDDAREQQSQITSTQDLLNVCSGNFTLESSDPSTQNLLERCPSNSTATSQSVVEGNERKELKGLDFEENSLISQLLDEEEMRNFKKKIESPKADEEESDGRGGVIDSDDDGDGENLEVKVKRTKTKLQFSDEESSDDEEDRPGNDEEIDLHDEDDDGNDPIDLPPENVDYDSEENEVVLDYNLAAKPNMKASDFFEEEAELSESDWDSADEDENDMDAMEAEQGDAEKYDENEIRRDLEKIHMRRLLDDDTKEVKLLQELYLEDGEFHGTGRERKFRWRNIDSFNDEEGGDKKNEDETPLYDEEESEEQWRKRRHEREMFLMEQQKKRRETDGGGESEEDELLTNSQLIKLGRQIITKSLNGGSQQKGPAEKAKSVEERVDFKSIFTLENRRGSFLSRGEQVLQRVAIYNKESGTSVPVTKTSKNFLFQTVSSEITTVTTRDRKRRTEDGTPNRIKKLRLSENLSPANRKPGKGSARSKSLFGGLD